MSTFLRLIILMTLSLNGNAQKNIAMDTALKNNSPLWKLKKQGAMPGKFFEMGEFKLVSVKKLNTENPGTGSKKKKFLSLGPLFGKSECSSQTIAYEITAMLLEDTADIRLDIYMTTVKDVPGILSKKDVTKTRHIEGIVGELRLRNDSLPWRIDIDRLIFNFPVTGKISNGTHQYEIVSVDRYEGRKPKLVLGPQPKGVIIKDQQGTELAALQLQNKKFARVKNSVSSAERMVFACCFSMILQSLPNIGEM